MKAIVPLVAMILEVVPVSAQPDDPKTVGRILHSMVWTGQEVLVWGGGSEGVFHRTGLRIDPAARGRTVMSDKGAPAGRWGHAAVWTGTVMIVWGGRDRFAAESHFDDGGR